MLTENVNEPEWSYDRFVCIDDFYRICSNSCDRDEALNNVKGAVLAAVGMKTVVPDCVEFFIDEITNDGIL
jgi:hypothetical protein